MAIQFTRLETIEQPSSTVKQTYAVTSTGTSAMGYPTLTRLGYYEIITPTSGYYKFQSCGNLGGGGAYTRIGLMYKAEPTESTVYYPYKKADGDTGIDGEFAMVEYIAADTVRYIAITSTYPSSQSNDKFQFDKCYKVTTQANNNAWGATTISGSGGKTEFYCYYGETIRLSAGPQTGYQFVKWIDSAGNTISTNPTFNFTQNKMYDAVYTAVFEPSASTPTTYAFTMKGDHSSYDSYSSLTPSKGTYYYTPGTTINLSVTAKPGYQINGWLYNTGSGWSWITTTGTTATYIMPNSDVTIAYYSTKTSTTTTYTIQFNGNGYTGGSLPSTMEVTGTSTSVTMGDISYAVPTRTGYTFRGWSSTSSYSSTRIAFGPTTGGAADLNGVSARQTSSTWTYQDYCDYTGYTGTSTTLTLYAQWESNTVATTYTLTMAGNVYDIDCHTALSPTKGTHSYTAGTSITLSVTPQSGCTIRGWLYNTGSGWEQITNSGTTATFTMPSSNVTVAYLGPTSVTPTTYTITYDANGGSVSPTYQTVTAGSSTITPTATRTGTTSRTIYFHANGGTISKSEEISSAPTTYGSNGWYTEASGGTWKVSNGGSYTPTQSETLYNHWYISSTGTYSAITFPTGTRTGHELVGFSTSSSTDPNTNFTGTGYEPGDKTIVDGTNYYAIWRPTSYKLSYDMNGGSGTIAEQTGGSSYTISSTRPTRIGWNFDGWSTNKNAAASYSPGDNISLSVDTVLYAIWSQKTISSGSNVNTVISYGGQKYWYKFTPASTGTYVIYSTGTADTYAHLYNTGGTQLGFNDDGNGSGNFRLEYNLTGGTTYYYAVRYFNSSTTGTIATHFGPVYTIQYDSKGGTSTPSNQSKDWGTTIQITSDEILKTGYEFKGWSTSSAATTVNYAPGANFTSNANSTLYAVWELVNYSITYILNNGTVSTANKTSYTIETSTFTLNNPTRTGHTFKGWSGPGLTEDTKTVTISKGSTGDRTYTANWTINSYQFTLGSATHVNTTGSTTSGSKQYGSTITLKATVDTGYTFGGWSSSNTSLIGNQTSANTSFSMPAGAITMTPSVSANQYTITYDIETNANPGDILLNKPSDTIYSYTGGTVKITSTIPQRTGYTFAGWGRTSNLTSNLLNSGATIDQAISNITLYAVWEKNIEITYDMNGGAGTPPTKWSTTIYNKDTGTYCNSLDNGSGFTKQGYTFIGWSTTRNNSSTKVSTSTIFTKSTVLYALWDINYYSLEDNINSKGENGQFNGNIYTITLQSGNKNGNTYSYDSIVQLKATPNTADAYKFLYWEVNGVLISNNPYNVRITSDTTIIAYFGLTSMSITINLYNSNNGNPIFSIPSGQEDSYVKLWMRELNDDNTYSAWQKKPFNTKLVYSNEKVIKIEAVIQDGEDYKFIAGGTLPQYDIININGDLIYSVYFDKIHEINNIYFGKSNEPYTSGYIDDPSISFKEEISSIWVGATQIMGKAPIREYPYVEDTLLGKTLYIGTNKPFGILESNDTTYENSSITEVIIPNGVTTIPSRAFYNCKQLTSVIIPDTVTEIGSQCFYSCTSLRKIYFPNHLSTLNSEVLRNCQALKKVKFSNSLTQINSSACRDLFTILKIDLGNTQIQTINTYVFSYCKTLKKIILPETLTKIDSYSFRYCSQLEEVFYKGTISQWNNINIVSTGNDYLKNATIYCKDGIINPKEDN